jgi:hypothetical protein
LLSFLGRGKGTAHTHPCTHPHPLHRTCSTLRTNLRPTFTSPARGA